MVFLKVDSMRYGTSVQYLLMHDMCCMQRDVACPEVMSSNSQI